MESHDHIRKPATSHASPSLNGTAYVPGDKSISHRSLMLASQAIGTTEIYGLLEGEDVHRTADALRLMGVGIQRVGKGYWHVKGLGVGGLHEPENILDMGNSGTSTRLLMGLVTPYGFNSFFTGDASLRRRPMGRIITPLEQMGARILSRSRGGKSGLLPLLLQGTDMPLPIQYRLPVASAQVKSGVLLAALNTPGVTTVIEPAPTRDHTERMLRHFGARLMQETDKDGAISIRLEGQQDLIAPAEPLHVPADPSSAAFPAVAALITQHSDITLPSVGMNPHRIGLFETLKEMGADIEWRNPREMSGEPVADLRIRSSRLRAVIVPASRAPSMIDEYPILAVAAACAEGTSIFYGLSELTVKESNRLEAVMEGLLACGVHAETGKDEQGEPWLKVTGNAEIQGGATIQAQLDHRIAMAFLVLGLVARRPVIIDDGSPIATSFPNFISLMQALGADMEMEEEAPVLAAPPAGVETKTRGPIQSLCIAIDGPAASGKGTLARRLASYFGLSYLDTGRLYRAVGLKLLNLNLDPSDEEEALKAARDLRDEDLLNPRLRQENVGNAASIVSASPLVRQALLEYQQQYARRLGGAILDGRDIGTVVCPDAEVKFYITASVEARARRRFQEVEGFEAQVDYDTVLAELRARDERDQKRAVAPLKPAKDAIIIDTSDMEPTEVFNKAVEIIESHLRRPQAKAS